MCCLAIALKYNLNKFDSYWLLLACTWEVACGQYKFEFGKKRPSVSRVGLDAVWCIQSPHFLAEAPLARCCKNKVFGLNGFSALGVDFRCRLCFVSVCSPDSNWSVGGMSGRRESRPAESPLTLRWADCVAWRPHPRHPLPPLPRQVRERPSPRAQFPFQSQFSCDLATQCFPTLSLCYLHSVGWLSCFFLVLS